MTKYSIKYGNKEINFQLKVSERKRLKIDVYPDMEVVVCAPVGKDICDIKCKVKKKANWILKQKIYFEQYQPLLPNKNYISGETHLYLGRQYRLKVLKSKNDDVKLIGKFIYVYTKEKQDNVAIKNLLYKWYNDHARKIFHRYIVDCYNSSERFHFEMPNYQIRKMTKRWGSYTQKGNIILNLELVKTPLYCIEYVIMHELCHMRVRNHDAQFYKLLTALMPDWKKRKQKLDSIKI